MYSPSLMVNGSSPSLTNGSSIFLVKPTTERNEEPPDSNQ
jgi:hypothetical protein